MTPRNTNTGGVLEAMILRTGRVIVAHRPAIAANAGLVRVVTLEAFIRLANQRATVKSSDKQSEGARVKRERANYPVAAAD